MKVPDLYYHQLGVSLRHENMHIELFPLLLRATGKEEFAADSSDTFTWHRPEATRRQISGRKLTRHDHPNKYFYRFWVSPRQDLSFAEEYKILQSFYQRFVEPLNLPADTVHLAFDTDELRTRISNPGPDCFEAMKILLAIAVFAEDPPFRSDFDSAKKVLMEAPPTTRFRADYLFEVLSQAPSINYKIPFGYRCQRWCPIFIQYFRRVAKRAKPAIPFLIACIEDDYLIDVAAAAAFEIDPNDMNVVQALIGILSSEYQIRVLVKAIKALSRYGPKAAGAIELLKKGAIFDCHHMQHECRIALSKICR